jgi:hypothetical protein
MLVKCAIHSGCGVYKLDIFVGEKCEVKRYITGLDKITVMVKGKDIPVTGHGGP